jgi:hypothetical protein
MAEARCGACSGTGGAYVDEYDEAGRPTGSQVWEYCETCGGTGIVWVPDEEPAPPEPAPAEPQPEPPRRRQSREPSDPRTSERLDRSFRSLLSLLFAGLLGWAAYATPFLRDMNVWVLLGVGLVLVALFYWGLTRIPKVIHILRIGFAWFLVLGLALAFAVGIYLALT